MSDNLATTRQNEEFWRGNTHKITIELFTDLGSPAILVAPTGDYRLALSDASAALLTKAASFSQDVDSGIWTMTIALGQPDTLAIAAGQFYHQATVSDVDASVITVMTGLLTVHNTI